MITHRHVAKTSTEPKQAKYYMMQILPKQNIQATK